MDAGCRVECCFCRLEFLEACLCCMALECCREAGSLVLPCRMLGDTGNSCWKEPARDEPCSSWRRINSACRNILELLDCVWRHCRIHCIRRNLVGCVLFVETPLYSVLEDRLKNLSLDIFSLLFFGNNSVHRIIVRMYAGCRKLLWIRPYVLLVEEMQIQPLF